MESSSLSSNWKRLQAKLLSEKAAENTSTKRKRLADDSDNTKTSKKLRVSKRSSPEQRKSKEQRSKTMNGTSKVGRARSLSAPDNVHLSPNRAASDMLKHSVSSTNVNGLVTDSQVNEGNSSINVAGKYISLDCEMVGTGPTPDTTSQLARVSLVNFHGDQVYDSFVLPELPVTDYRTAVSGITASLLKNGRTFGEVCEDVATLLKGRVLVGHGLKNDLSVLLSSHPKGMIRDTAHHRPWKEKFCNGGIPSLRLLAQEILGWQSFQEGEHNSVEDARAAMALFRIDKEAFEAESRRKFGQSASIPPKSPQNGHTTTEGEKGDLSGSQVARKSRKKGKRK